MNDDELFRGLARAARDDDAALDAPAPEDSVARIAQSPLGAEARARIAARLARGRTAPVVSMPPPRRRSVALVAGALAAAAGLVLVVSFGRTGGAIPEYALEVSGGDRALRGGSDRPKDETVHVAPGSRLELLLRPKTRVEGPVEARGFVTHGGDAKPWAAKIEIAEGGAVRVGGEASELFPGLVGPVDVAIVVGRPGHVPLDSTSALAPGRDGVHVVRWRVVVEPGD